MGYSIVGGIEIATEWTGGTIINLGGLSGSTGSEALDINEAGQVVGYSDFLDGHTSATEWSGGLGGSIINLGGLPGSTFSEATGINDAGQVAGFSFAFNHSPVPEPSTWAMMLAGFAGLVFAGYRRSERVLAQNARLSIYQPDV